ncbi:cation:proton antiporter [Tessaracoccus rhinocerotis]|uniref:Cation:proton antiporter n=1 Tax=Tessaracoccus rhinocerotis TaxID=1689449 RepID=A0A553K0R8_9ACTN|nr:cation:proton antiporter [Tessaracoccus rhinocerotis]
MGDGAVIGLVTDILLVLATLVIGAAALLAIGRVVAGPSALDRIVASDLLVAIVTGGVALWIVNSGQHGLLVILLLLSILGFTGAASMARLMGDRVMLARRHEAEQALLKLEESDE